jgi:hypothetical protein
MLIPHWNQLAASKIAHHQLKRGNLKRGMMKMMNHHH